MRVRPHPDVLIVIRPVTSETFDFDFAAREVSSQARLDGLCSFMRLVGTALQRDVALSPEGAPASWFCRFESASGAFALASPTQ